MHTFFFTCLESTIATMARVACSTPKFYNTLLLKQSNQSEILKKLHNSFQGDNMEFFMSCCKTISAEKIEIQKLQSLLV